MSGDVLIIPLDLSPVIIIITIITIIILLVAEDECTLNMNKERIKLLYKVPAAKDVEIWR